MKFARSVAASLFQKKSFFLKKEKKSLRRHCSRPFEGGNLWLLSSALKWNMFQIHAPCWTAAPASWSYYSLHHVSPAHQKAWSARYINCFTNTVCISRPERGGGNPAACQAIYHAKAYKVWFFSLPFRHHHPPPPPRPDTCLLKNEEIKVRLRVAGIIVSQNVFLPSMQPIRGYTQSCHLPYILPPSPRN